MNETASQSELGLPIVTIIGRPNVGKSSLLNAMARSRIAIVESTPGVTRDRLGVVIEGAKKPFELVDTGGIGIVDESRLADQIEIQIDFALNKADLVIFLLDGKDGVTHLDTVVAQKLRELDRPALVVVNKLDSPERDADIHDFHRLGLGEPMGISVTNRRGIKELLRAITDNIPRTTYRKPDLPVMRVAMVGRQNVGKSTFINALAKQDRVIVSEIPGTTRDAVDVRFERDGRVFVAVDTAGLRKKSQMKKDNIEFYSMVRTETAIRNADLIFFLVDARAKITKVDKQLAEMIEKSGKPVVIVLNKWDLTEGVVPEDYVKYMNEMLPGLIYAPLSFTSAKVDFNVWETVEFGERLMAQGAQKIPTAAFNDFLEAATGRHRPPIVQGRRGKVYYGTQTGIQPPTFTLFVNEPKLFPDDYKRYLENKVRDELGFPEIPVRLRFKPRPKVKLD
jgi:GTP-binding protein